MVSFFLQSVKRIITPKYGYFLHFFCREWLILECAKILFFGNPEELYKQNLKYARARLHACKNMSKKVAFLFIFTNIGVSNTTKGMQMHTTLLTTHANALEALDCKAEE